MIHRAAEYNVGGVTICIVATNTDTNNLVNPY